MLATLICDISKSYMCVIYMYAEEMFTEKHVAYTVDRVKCKGTMTKWPVPKQTLKTRETGKTTRRYIHWA